MDVKQFRQPAPNQELVLAVFEESHWEVDIDDPLHPDGKVDPKRRLRATVWALNRNQANKLIQFSADGTGKGIRWQRVA